MGTTVEEGTPTLRASRPSVNLSSEMTDEDKAALQETCRTAGIKDEFANAPHKVDHLQLILDSYCELKVVRHFRNLKTLTLIQQGLTGITGLGYLRHLDSLWLNENQISCLDGIQGCRNLKCLYVDGNQIEQIGHWLLGLNEIHTLWIAENKLKDLRGIANLPKLCHLHAPSNQITTLEPGLDKLKNLEHINVANNKLHTFKCVSALQHFQSLQEVNFNDPEFGTNPFCQITNYSVYVLFHLPTLKILDRYSVTQIDRTKAESEYLRKRLFYNMRIKSTRRLANQALKHLVHTRSELALTIDHHLGLLRKEKLNLLDVPGQKQDLIEKKIRSKYQEYDDIQTTSEYFKSYIKMEQDRLIKNHLIEYENGGNIWIEDGEFQQDGWYNEVSELVTNAFQSSDGVKSIEIESISKLHNQTKELVFDQFMEPDAVEIGSCGTVVQRGRGKFKLAQGAGPSIPHNTQRPEILFHLEDPNLPGSNHPGDPMIPMYLTNNATLPISAQVAFFRKQPVGQAFHRAMLTKRDKSEITIGPSYARLTLVSTFLVSAKPDLPSNFEWDPNVPISELYGNQPSKISGCSAPYRVQSGATKTKIWCIREQNCVMPTYVVNIKINYENPPPPVEVPASVEGPFLQSVMFDFISYANEATEGTDVVEAAIAQSPIAEEVDTIDVFREEELALVIPLSEKIEELIKLSIHARGLRRIEGSTFRSLQQLQILTLSHNNLESLRFRGTMVPLVNLKELDISFNIIERVDNFDTFPNLTTLDFSHNHLCFEDSVHNLAQLNSLTDLRLIGNPVIENDSCRYAAIHLISSLCILDEKKIDEQDRIDAARIFMKGNLNDDLLYTHSYMVPSKKLENQWFCTDPDPAFKLSNQVPELMRERSPVAGNDTASRSRRGSLVSVSRSPSNLSPDRSPVTPSVTKDSRDLDALSRDPAAEPLVLTAPTTEWKNQVYYLHLEDQKLTSLDEFKGFTQLLRLNLRKNQLTSIAVLSEVTTLKELNVEENYLENLIGLENMKDLIRLDAGNNRLVNVGEISRCSNLLQLSLEENYVDSLETFAYLSSLIELYLSNNLIEDLRCVLSLKNLTQLTILDLCGNPLVKQRSDPQEYRLYIIFHLRRLKIFDSICITPNELHDAKDQFAGKLSMELFEEKLGPLLSAGYTTRSLDLSNCRIKEMTNLLGDAAFPCLRELILHNNPLNVHGLRPMGALSKLSVLRCSGTKLDLDEGFAPKVGETIGIQQTVQNLHVLELNYDSIESILALSRVPLNNLRILHLIGNDITKVEGIGHLIHLRELVLDKNRIRHVEPASFSGLRSLKSLRMAECGLRSLSHFEHLPRNPSTLRSLHLANNRLQETVEVQHLSFLQLHTIDLSNTPLSKRPWYRFTLLQTILTLQVIDGKGVMEEEREAVERQLEDQQAGRRAQTVGLAPVVQIVLDRKKENKIHMNQNPHQGIGPVGPLGIQQMPNNPDELAKQALIGITKGLIEERASTPNKSSFQARSHSVPSNKYRQ